MNPTVLAAAIGVGGTVIVGITGFWASVRNTSTTVLLARETRIWDQRAAVYVDAIFTLQLLLRGYLVPGATYTNVPRLEEVETKLQAWASESVLTAWKSAAEFVLPFLVDRALSASAALRASDALTIGDPAGRPDPVVPAIRDSDPTPNAVSTAENLVELMRSELQGRRSGSPGRRPRRHGPPAALASQDATQGRDADT